MRIFLFALLMMVSGVSAYAQSTAHKDLLITVNGMVCDFCAQAVWKVFEKYDAVGSVDIDLDKGLVTVHLKPDQSLSQDEIDHAITYAGYDFVGMEERAHQG
ncbi:MAG: heavy-metal-associated domain-containing protein [Bdellovibrionales bacterium]